MRLNGLRGMRLIISLALLAGSIVLGWSDSALAVDCPTPNHLPGSNFEIDTDGNLKVDGSNPCIDWLAGGTGSAFRSGVTSKADKPTGADDDSFGQGTSEDNADPTIVSGSIPPNKSDLKTFGVYSETGSTAKYLVLFWARVQDPQGTTNMDFELNQKRCDPAANPTNCANNGKNVVPETPLRTAGDKLITYDLAKGGTVPAISIRTWTGSAWGTPTTVSGGSNPSAIGSVNTSTINASDANGLGSLSPYTFGEAAINFNSLFPSGGTCGTFGSAYLKSRSSDSFSAAVKDFIAPEAVHLTNCAEIVTNATASTTIGSPISDTATLSGITANAGGTITFRLYSDATCSTQVSTGLNPVAVNGPGNYSSGNFTPAAIGTYYWIASYSGDLNNGSAAGACGDANESSIVIRRSPSITTNATASTTIGGPISDTATLSNATSDAGGTITFRLYSNATCTTEVITGLSPVTVSGNGNYNSGNVTPTAVGSYYWIASYSGDAKNNPASGACGDANESSQVNRKQPSISTTATASAIIGNPISDTATLSNATSDAAGTITFRLYSNATCTAEVTTGLNPVTVNGNGNYNSGTVTPSVVGTYYWIASYSGDAKNSPVSGSCGDAGESSLVDKAGSSVGTAQKLYPQDSATVSSTAGGTPGGTVTFRLYGPNDSGCSGPVRYTETVTLVNGKADTSNTTFSVNASTQGQYRWIVSYSGDANHYGSTSACGVENYSLVINNG